jgi:hypothetical protein
VLSSPSNRRHCRGSDGSPEGRYQSRPSGQASGAVFTFAIPGPLPRPESPKPVPPRGVVPLGVYCGETGI